MKTKFKDIKKILTFAIVGSMLATSTQIVSAIEEDTTITIDQPKGNEYKAFKLMNLKTDGEHYAYSVNPIYKNIIMEVIQEIDIDVDVSTDEKIIKYLETLTDARIFADKIYTKIKEQNITAELTTTTGIFSDATQGYYLIAETGTIATGTDRTLVMLDTLGKTDITVTEKRGVPTLDKVIVENNIDVEHVNAGLNDEIIYKITGTMPENIASYSKYKYIIHDNLPEGITYKDIISISINGVELTNFAEFEVKNPTDCSIEFKFDDIKSTTKTLGIELNADTKVVIQYKAVLNDKAVVGNPGNQNTAHLEFSNDPYDDGSTENTPDDDAKVFTFAVAINKVDKDSKPLTGAEFSIQKEINGNWVDMTNETVEYIKNEDGTIFTFEGLDVGKYKLIESTVPTGYNKADDVIFTILANYENETVKTLTVYDKDGNIIGQTNLEDENAIFSIDSTNGVISTDVINTTGIKLPSTGSLGAIIVYCASGVTMTLCIASFVIAKKKKNN